jgi:hypothetical protein
MFSKTTPSTPAPEVKTQPAVQPRKYTPLEVLRGLSVPQPPKPPTPPPVRDDRTELQKAAQAIAAECERHVRLYDTMSFGGNCNSIKLLGMLEILSRQAKLISAMCDHLNALDAERRQES